MSKMSADIKIMVDAAEKAARSLLRDFGEVEQLQISKKGPADFVSAADKRAEKILHKELSEARPDYGFIMEEGGSIKGKDGAAVFIIDPLDGTTNFLHGIPHWCISIAIVENGKTRAGVVFAPVTGEMFWAERGEGAFVGRKKLWVSGHSRLSASMIATGNLLPSNPWYNQTVDAMTKAGKQEASIRRLGAAALELSYVAAGRIDGFWETGLKIWDVAAGMLFVEEAKGKITSLNPDNSDALTSGSILATNGLLHDQMQSIVGYVKQ